MSENTKRYGYTGQGLRVDLTSGKVTVEKTLPRFEKEMGGTGIGYRVFWDEVAPDTKPLDPANKIVIAPGPLTGSGAVCSGRTSVTTIFPTAYPVPALAAGHLGGDLGARLKFAGWDFIIIEGKSPKPVYLHIKNDKVELRDAAFVWGQGTRRSYEMLAQHSSPESAIAVIGPAGENLVPMSILLNAKSHSAGGVGAVFGSKLLKGLVVEGDGPIHIAADKREWEKLCDFNRSLLGAVTQTVVPKYPNPLFEYYSGRSRWTGLPGKTWGGANPPIHMSKDIRSLNRISYRTCAADHYLSPGQSWRFVVRNNGCFACPIRCSSVMRDEETAAMYNVSPITEGTCMVLYFGRQWFPCLWNKKPTPEARRASIVGIQLQDDYGVWCNYGQLQRDFRLMASKGIWKKVLPEKEYNEIPWKLLDEGNPMFLHDIYRRIIERKGEMGYWLGEGSGYLLEHFGIEEQWKKTLGTSYWGMGHPKHHANEDDGQVGCVINCMYNRDPMLHSTVNYTRTGLPFELLQQIGKELWGDASTVDDIGDYHPTNRPKMVRARWCLARNELHNMIGLCSWSAPWFTSPVKEMGYRGDVEMEAKLMTAVTGRKVSGHELDERAISSFILQRAYTMRQMKTVNMRRDHDKYPDWIFMDAKDRKPFTKGTIRMDRDDIEKSFDIFYDVMGWDVKTGAPTAECYRKAGLDFAIDTMRKEGLMP